MRAILLAWYFLRLRLTSFFLFLQDDDKDLALLKRITAHGEKAIPKLIACLHNEKEDYYARSLAAKGLSKIGGNQAAIALAIHTDDKSLRSDCLKALREMPGEYAERILSVVDRRLQIEAENIIMLVVSAYIGEKIEPGSEPTSVDAESMVLTPAIAVTVLLNELPLWLIGENLSPRRIDVSPPYGGSHAVIAGLGGGWIDNRRGNSVLIQDLAPTTATVRNWKKFILSVPEGSASFMLHEPFLISGRSDLKMKTVRVTVDLEFDTYAENADAIARASPPPGYSLTFYPLEDYLNYSNIFSEAAAEYRPGEGNWLPVFMTHDYQTIYGALQLMEKYSDKRFDAKLILSQDVPVPVGALLRRRVVWESVNLHSVERRVASIIEVY